VLRGGIGVIEMGWMASILMSGGSPRSIFRSSVTLLITFFALATLMFLLADPEVDAQPDLDFEWKVPVLAANNGYQQDVESVEYDEVTGETYLIWNNRGPFSGGYAPEAHTMARIDAKTNELEQCATFEYLGYPRYHIVHDGKWYLIYQKETSNNQYDGYMRVHGEDMDRMVWRSIRIRAVLGVHDNHIVMVAHDDATSKEQNNLYSISLETFESTSIPLFDFTGNRRAWEFILRNGTVYSVYYKSTSDWQRDFIELHTYEIGSLERKDPIYICDWDYGEGTRMKFDVDSKGNIHLLLQSNCTLMKFNPSGDLIARTQIQSPIDQEGTSWYASNIIINQTDWVFIIGTVRTDSSLSGTVVSATLSNSYGSGVAAKTISDDFISAAYYGLTLNGSDRIFTALTKVVDTDARVAISLQIDPTPDLSISERYLRVEERPSMKEPVEFSIRIKNVGQATSTSFTLSIYQKPLVGGMYTLVHQEVSTQMLPAGEKVWFTGATRVPKGNCMLRFEVHQVTPFENFRHNNVIEVQSFIATNNPPELQIHSPLNGTTWDDLMIVYGSAIDIDYDPNITTSIWGLPNIDIKVNGNGDWNHTIELDIVPSGIYVVQFRASDGSDDSMTVARTVIIDHIEDSLIHEGHYPEGDVVLLTGQTETFVFNVTERFSRNLTFEWTMNDNIIGSDVPYHHYLASTIGSFELRVSVTNGRSTALQKWNISVRDPIVPSVNGWSPDSPILLPKGSEIDLSFTIDNPDDVVISIVWFLDNLPAPDGGGLMRTYEFSDPSSHKIKAMIVSEADTDEVSWEINVINKPPEIIEWTPNETHIQSIGPVLIEFTVYVEDNDDTSLQYTWSSINTSILSANENRSRAEFTDIGSYHISLLVSDGIDTTYIEWTIGVLEKNPPITSPENELLPWMILLFLLSVVVVIYAIFRLRASGENNNDNG